MLRAVLVATLAALALAAPAGATTLVLADGTVGPQPYQSWIDASRIPTPAGDVLLRMGDCGDLASLVCTTAGERVIDADPSWLGRNVLLHEVGHIFDRERMTPESRAAFAAVIHRRDPWSGPVETNPPAEQFAEAYSLCARHPRIRRQHTMSYHYAPTPAQHLRVCALIRNAAG